MDAEFISTSNTRDVSSFGTRKTRGGSNIRSALIVAPGTEGTLLAAAKAQDWSDASSAVAAEQARSAIPTTAFEIRIGISRTLAPQPAVFKRNRRWRTRDMSNSRPSRRRIMNNVAPHHYQRGCLRCVNLKYDAKTSEAEAPQTTQASQIGWLYEWQPSTFISMGKLSS
jgi:hypothetical protein